MYRPASDLVRDSKLKTAFHNEYTKHVIDVSGPNARQRRARQEQRWRRVKCLGEGSFGTVWLENLIDGQSQVNERAVKIIRKRVQRSKTIDYSRELEALAKFSHRNYNSCFVESFGWFEDDNSVFIAMEYFPLGDLSDYLNTTLPEPEVQQISYQILEGLGFMHENGFAHRDLKPSNILVRSSSPDWWVKIGDFGISKRAEEGSTALRTFNGTPGFIAPEVLAQNGMLDSSELEDLREYTVAVDLWSLGEIIFRALTQKAPFSRGLASYIKGTLEFPLKELHNQQVSADGCDFIARVMKPKPKERITAVEALEHPWIASQRPISPRSSDEIQRSTPISGGISGNPGHQSHFSDSGSVKLEASAVWSTIGDSTPGSTGPTPRMSRKQPSISEKKITGPLPIRAGVPADAGSTIYDSGHGQSGKGKEARPRESVLNGDSSQPRRRGQLEDMYPQRAPQHNSPLNHPRHQNHVTDRVGAGDVQSKNSNPVFSHLNSLGSVLSMAKMVAARQENTAPETPMKFKSGFKIWDTGIFLDWDDTKMAGVGRRARDIVFKESRGWLSIQNDIEKTVSQLTVHKVLIRGFQYGGYECSTTSTDQYSSFRIVLMADKSNANSWRILFIPGPGTGMSVFDEIFDEFSRKWSSHVVRTPLF